MNYPALLQSIFTLSCQSNQLAQDVLGRLSLHARDSLHTTYQVCSTRASMNEISTRSRLLGLQSVLIVAMAAHSM